MHLRITIVGPSGPRLVLLRARPGARWSDVVPLLPRSDPWYAGAPGQDGGELLGPGQQLGECPLVDGAIVSARVPQSRRRAGVRAPVDLLVTEGPDCGAVRSLTAASVVKVGRDPLNDLCLNDPGLSRHQLTVRITRRGVLVEDLGATNRASLDGTPLTGSSVWMPGQRLRAGGTTFELREHRHTMQATADEVTGTYLVVPAPQPLPVVADVVLNTQQLDAAPDVPRLPVLTWVIPFVLSCVLALVLRMPYLLLFGLMAPAMSLGSYLADRRSHRRRQQEVSVRNTEAGEAAKVQAARAVADELATRRARTPDLATLCCWVRDGPGSPLWRVGPDDPLICRVGTGRLELRVRLDGHAQVGEAVPVEVDLTGGIAILGPPEVVRACARSLLTQLLLRYPPDRVGVDVPGTARSRPEWAWLGWAPHARSATTATCSSRVTVLDHLDPDSPMHDDTVTPAPREVPMVLLPRGPAPALGTVVQLDHRGGFAVGPATNAGAQGGPVAGRGDLLAEPRAAWLVRALAPLRQQPGQQTATLPASVDLTRLLPELDPDAVAEQWRRQPSSTSCAVGVGLDGTFVLDLAADGPHALIGGTTGAGKSELLRTLIASLAVVNRPDQLVFVLVDYKGGAAFAEASRLPHTVGVVTDLDTHLADRALTSLTAELKRRERLLFIAGARDIEGYRAIPGVEPLARLVLVIDEFRALVQELPTFLDGLVRVAALGRSLGVHLVLATQRPAGIVSADVRANVNLRIALRMRDASDSYDVLDVPDAAALPEGVPGRALVRTGANPPRTVQVARVMSAPAAVAAAEAADFGDGNAATVVQVIELTSPWDDVVLSSAGSRARMKGTVSPLGTAGIDGTGVISGRGSTANTAQTPATAGTAWTADTGGTTDRGRGVDGLAGLADVLIRAASTVGSAAPPSPWLPPLPDVVPLDHLPAEPAAPLTVSYGLLDRPQEQRVVALRWQPVSDGHLAVVGAPRSGRSTAVRSIVGGLAERATAGDLHIYGFDMGGALGAVAELPHTGSLVGPDDPLLGARVLERLADQLTERRAALARAGLTSLEEQRATEAPWPLVLLVIDGWPRFVEIFGAHARGHPIDTFVRLLREGPAAGMTAVLTGDRSLLGGRIGSLLPNVWCLRLSDPTDLMVTGLSPRQLPTRMPAGRAIRVADGAVAHIGVLGADGSGQAQLRAMSGIAHRARQRDVGLAKGPRPWQARSLPTSLHWDDRLASASDDPPGLLVGVGGDDAGAVRLALDPAVGGTALIAGPARSGRTTVLKTLARAGRDLGLTVVWVDRQRPAHSDLKALAESLDAAARFRHQILVLVDDVAALADSPAEATLLAWAAAIPRGGGLMVGAGDVDQLGQTYRGLGPLLARSRTGLLLQPMQPSDGSVFGVSVASGGPPLPGRGLLLDRGRATPVQVLLP